MPTGSAHIPPARRFDLACAIAGALAEAGIQHLDLTRNGVTESLSARTTDLPAHLLEGDFKLTAPSVEIQQTGDQLAWSTTDAHLASALNQACMDMPPTSPT